MRILYMSLAVVILIGASAFGQAPDEVFKENKQAPKEAPKTEPAKADDGSDPWLDWKLIEQRYSPKAIDALPDGEAKEALKEVVASEGQARSSALADFKKGAGLGITVTMSSSGNVIEDAQLVDNKIRVTKRSKDVPRAMMEVHQLFTTNVFTPTGRENARKQLLACEARPINCPLFGIGPFAAIQTGTDDSLSSVGLGVMIGVRTDPRKDASFNLGIGIVWDGKVKRLASGFKEGEALPTGETAIRFEEKSARGLMIGISFGF